MNTTLHCRTVLIIPVSNAEADHMAALDEPPEIGKDQCRVITALLETLPDDDSRLSEMLNYVLDLNNGSLINFVVAERCKRDGLGVKDMLRAIFRVPLPNYWWTPKLSWQPDCTRFQVVVPERATPLYVAVNELARRLA